MTERKHGQNHSITGTLNGTYEAYDTYLHIYKQAKFESGMLHGLYKEYYEETKQVKIEGHYENGMKQGAWSEFDKKGKILVVKIWNKGEMLERTMFDDELGKE
ncbi:MAG: hypothetical protein WCJ94_06790 [bacterium]